MQCSANGCQRAAMYKAAMLCQMHYFRVMRNGTTEKLKTSRKQKIITPNGYWRVFDPEHPLADKRGYVFEHRHVMWSAIGSNTGPCETCKKPESWKTCHIDHIDEDRGNNDRSNLRVLCRACNTGRGFKPECYKSRSSYGLIAFDGKEDTAEGWSRDARVSVSGKVIRDRKNRGMSDYDALFAPKKTHKQRA